MNESAIAQIIITSIITIPLIILNLPRIIRRIRQIISNYQRRDAQYCYRLKVDLFTYSGSLVGIVFSTLAGAYAAQIDQWGSFLFIDFWQFGIYVFVVLFAGFIVGGLSGIALSERLLDRPDQETH